MALMITPHLWCKGNAREMANHYIQAFPNTSIIGGSKYPESQEEGLADFQTTLAGNDLTINLSINNCDVVLINAGPEFTPTPANSFMINFDPKYLSNARECIEHAWNVLLDEGIVLMPLDKYDFSECYGWIQDKYGFNWQLILTNPEGEDRPFLLPSLTFTGPKAQAKEAIDFYTNVFANSKVGQQHFYKPEQLPISPGMIWFADFALANNWFTCMDGGTLHNFDFNEAVSYCIACNDQDEIDYYWSKLSAVPASEVCGWCKDKFGVSWQVVPSNIADLLQRKGAFQILMSQQKIVIADYD